jgi:phage terminase Nu1 subunit (DNA packaging protein)
MHADFELDSKGVVRPSERHGGARANAGRKPAGYEKPQEIVDFDRERARNEKAKADLNELEYKIKSGEYVPRAAVQQAAATMLASIAQTLRSIPDTLERRVNLSPDVAEVVGLEIDSVLEGLGEELRMLAGDDNDL